MFRKLVYHNGSRKRVKLKCLVWKWLCKQIKPLEGFVTSHHIFDKKSEQGFENIHLWFYHSICHWMMCRNMRELNWKFSQSWLKQPCTLVEIVVPLVHSIAKALEYQVNISKIQPYISHEIWMRAILTHKMKIFAPL